MTKLHNKLSAAISHLCAVLLGFLGYGCSSSDPDPGDYICMYGSPTGSFEIKGDVTDDSGTAVSEAEIKVIPSDAPSAIEWCIAKGLSEANGRYSVSGSHVPFDTLKVVCLPPLGSNLEPDSVFTVMKYAIDEKHPAEMWYVGHAEGVANFKLKRKSDK